MPIAHRASTTAEANGFAGVTNNVPTGTVNGDVLIWRISSTSANPPTLLTGWSEITPTVTVGAGCSMYWYRVASSEPASYTSDPFGSGGRSVGVMSAYSGVNNTTPFDVTTPTPVTGTTAFGSLSITPVTPGAWILAMARAQVGSAVLGTTLSSTNLDAIDAQVSSTSVSATNEVGAIAHEAWVTGAFTPDWSSSQTTARTAVAVAALRPSGWVASSGTVASANSKVAGATFTTGAISCPIGDQIFLFVTFDNLTTTTPTISTITKPGTETSTWAQVAAGDSASGTAAAGIRGEFWAITPTVTWTTFSPVVTLSGSVDAKASAGFCMSGGGLTVGSAFHTAVIAKSPSFYGRHNEAANGTGTLLDSSSNGRLAGNYSNITFGTASLIPGEPTDNAATYNGTSSKGEVGFQTYMNSDASALSLYAVAKSTVSPAGDRYLMSRDGSSIDRVWQFGVTGGKLFFIKVAGVVVSLSPAATYADGNTHHFGATYDGSNIRLYVDGAKVQTTAAAGGLGTASRTLDIGTLAGAFNFWSGDYDDWGYWAGTVLSDADYADLYAARLTTYATLRARETLPMVLTQSSSATPSLVTSGTPVTGDLVIGIADRQQPPATFGADADTLNGSWSTAIDSGTTGGTSNTNVNAYLQTKIVTAGGNQTYNLTGALSTGHLGVIALIPAAATTAAQVSRTHAETLILPTPDARVSRTHAESLLLPTATAEVSRVHAEVLVSVAASLSGTWTVS